jgi:hypothetical protein
MNQKTLLPNKKPPRMLFRFQAMKVKQLLRSGQFYFAIAALIFAGTSQLGCENSEGPAGVVGAITSDGLESVSGVDAGNSNKQGVGAIKQTVDVVGQGPAGPVVAELGATVIRTKNGVRIALTMPTPMPGSYSYPPPNGFQTIAPAPGTPEVFTGWAFIFNEPENCAVPYECIPPPPGAPAPNDFTEARGGVHNYAGHAISGSGTLNLVGHISVGESRFGGPFGLEDPVGAEIHVAAAPHGVLLPELLPDQINTPVGSPPFWWLALFPAP